MYNDYLLIRDESDLQEIFAAEKLLNALLDLERGLVGIKICQSQAEYEALGGRELVAPMPYCVAVECATRGHALKLRKLSSGCTGSTRALGLEPASLDFYEGKEGCALGLYDSPKRAANVASKLAILPAETFGVVIKPLSQFEEPCDVVVVVANSYNAMRIVQAYSYSHGSHEAFNMMGNQAVCVESTVIPMLTGTLNVSLLCAGTRHNARWTDSELMLGIPLDQFSSIVKGVKETANSVEPDAKKAAISKRLKELGYDAPELKAGEAYYLKKT